MENKENDIDNDPKSKTVYDFFLLFLALVGLIAVLLFLKYAISALNLL